MTVQEIAKATNMKDRAVRNWVKKAAAKNAAITAKNAASSPMRPADYDLDETVQIIEAGMGSYTAALYRQAAEKPYESMTAASLASIITTAVRAALTETNAKIDGLGKEIRSGALQLEHKPEYFSALAFSIENNLETDMKSVRSLAVEARKASIAMGYDVRRIPDERYGEVNAYHKTVLESLLG